MSNKDTVHPVIFATLFLVISFSGLDSSQTFFSFYYCLQDYERFIFAFKFELHEIAF